jgi:hypothetical protein
VRRAPRHPLVRVSGFAGYRSCACGTGCTCRPAADRYGQQSYQQPYDGGYDDRGHDNRGYGDQGSRKKKKESWLSDLFD